VEFFLTGFQQDANIRRYAFERTGDGRANTRFTVGVDLATVRRYGIPLQELPLLCRRLLEDRNAPTQAAALTFSEEDMAGYANRRAARAQEAEAKRRARRPIHSRNIGKAWR
jgi:hypothetical protein